MNYLRDGDSASFKVVKNFRPYGDTEVKKLECVGHVQKRLGSRLRKLRVQMKGKKLPDGKLLSGAGRLTDKKIDTLQNYFGLAIRQQKDDLLGMQWSVLATLYHVASTDDAPNHSFGPAGSDSWCKYNVNADNYHHKHGLPPAVLDIVEPIFSDLADCDLLSKCLHGKTQNNNESINNLVWRYCRRRCMCLVQPLQMLLILL